ncbi:MAG: T9SS type A sorting domain-containing protein [bacterium]
MQRLSMRTHRHLSCALASIAVALATPAGALQTPATLRSLDVSYGVTNVATGGGTEDFDSATQEDPLVDWTTCIAVESPAPWYGTFGNAEIHSVISVGPTFHSIGVSIFVSGEASGLRDPVSGDFNSADADGAGRFYLNVTFLVPVNYLVSGSLWASGDAIEQFVEEHGEVYGDVTILGVPQTYSVVENQIPVLQQGTLASGGNFSVDFHLSGAASAWYDDVQQQGHHAYAAAGLDLTLQFNAAATGASLVVGRDFTVTASPNPFRGNTRITAARPAEGASAVLSVFDVHGRLVRRWTEVGPDRVIDWDGRTALGEVVPAGVYFVRADDGAQQSVAKLVRLR